MTKTANPRSSQKDANKPNVFGMIQNIAIAAMNKGQFPMACIVSVVLFIIYKMPPADVSKLAFQIMHHFVITHILGWILSLILTLGWYYSFKRLRRIHFDELERIANEKDALQQLLIK